jgi:hypothetical protein
LIFKPKFDLLQYYFRRNGGYGTTELVTHKMTARIHQCLVYKRVYSIWISIYYFKCIDYQNSNGMLKGHVPLERKKLIATQIEK